MYQCSRSKIGQVWCAPRVAIGARRDEMANRVTYAVLVCLIGSGLLLFVGLLWGGIISLSSPAPQAPLAQPSSTTLETCRTMYPVQPEMEQACIRRWTYGESMPGPARPQGTGLTLFEIVANCSKLESTVNGITECTERWLPVMQGRGRY
jgi:hypothetical protein